jgi:hypothetical protein
MIIIILCLCVLCVCSLLVSLSIMFVMKRWSESLFLALIFPLLFIMRVLCCIIPEYILYSYSCLCCIYKVNLYICDDAVMCSILRVYYYLFIYFEIIAVLYYSRILFEVLLIHILYALCVCVCLWLQIQVFITHTRTQMSILISSNFKTFPPFLFLSTNN